MKELKLKIKRDYYNIFKELTDKQAGELIKGVCAYIYDGKPFETKDDYLKGIFIYIKRDIDFAKQRRRKEAVVNLAAVIGSVIAAAECAAAGGEDSE